MIQLYAKGTTDFTKNGIILHPQESTVTFQDNGQFDLEMVLPASAEHPEFDYGQIIEATVPEQDLAAVTLGDISYFTVSKAEGTALYSEVPSMQYVSYANWIGYSQTEGQHQYAIGSNVTYNGRNYTCNTWDPSSPQGAVPPDNNSWWTEIPRVNYLPGKTVETLAYGTTIMKTAEFNTEYMEAATLDGKAGYVKIADCTATGESGSRVIPARTITTQRFIITEIRKEQQGKAIRLTAEHVSYQLSRTILGECSVTGVTPATALLFIAGAMKEEYSGGLYTNMQEPTLTADWSWKNAQSAVMDPKNGLLAISGARMIRDNLDVFILADANDGTKYSIRYGANMKDVKWTGNVDNMVTRIYPTAQTEDGRTLLLPEEYIDSVRTVPFIRPEVLSTGLKVGQKVKNSDGTETELTEEEIYTRMREAASNRFNIDKCDQAEISLEVDWQHMPDTEEYAAYNQLKNAAPGELVEVVNGPLGINTVIRMSGYTWDPVGESYKSATFGAIKTRPTVAGYALKNGSVGSLALAYNAVGGANIQQGSITAREIEANSITAEQIASRSIQTELLAANAVTANEINAGSVTADKVAAGAITTVKLDAQAVTAEKISAGAVTAVKIDANAVTAEKIAAGAVTAGKIDAGAITAEKIDAGAVTAVKIAAGAVTAGKIDAGAVTAAAIDAGAVTAVAIAAEAVTSEKIYAGAVVADKIASGAITTAKLDAYAVTADKLAAGAVQADKIAAGAITAAKIDTNDLAAINATLGTASIAQAQIASADISYAKVKDLTAGTAIFDTTITEQGIADRLFISRLMITYGQMVSATIGDLVIGASDGNYYHVDVEWDENGEPTLVPVQVTTPSAEEIAAGHTNGGKTIIGDVGTYAELSSTDFYAINSIIDRITAKRIDVDELWAREAFIDKLMVQDISSNTYIRSTIGDWQSSSTITQSIDSLDSRISGLGYGTVYMQPDEPDHSNLVSGDVWIQTIADTTWQQIYDNQTDYPSWQAIYNNVSTWQVLGAIPKMLVWDGRKFQLMYDAILPNSLETEIEQLATAITLKASKDTVDQLTGEVSEFRAQLTIQADEIESAVSAVNAKAASDVMWADPHTAHGVSLGDIWVKRDPHFCDDSTWQDVYDYFETWNQLYTVHDAWDDMLGDRTFIWNGTEWIETSDRAAEIYQETRIDQTSTQVSILAESTAQIGDTLITVQAGLTVANDRISSEVERSMAAEDLKIDKTGQYQTADSIVTEAVRQAGVSADEAYVTKTTALQTADSIVTEAVRQAGVNASGENGFIAKTTALQTANNIITEAVRIAGANASGENGFIAKTTAMQTADNIITEAVRQSGVNATAGFIAKTSQFQSADEIKSEAVRLAGVNATAGFIAKTTAYQTADALYTAAVNQAGTNAAGLYLQKTTTYQTADSIVNTATKTAAGNIAPEFSVSSAYVIGDIVSYGSKVYRFKANHAAGNWNAAQVDEITTSGAYIAKTSQYQTADSIRLEAQKETTKVVAPEFKVEADYGSGSIVSYNGRIYRFKTIKMHGNWDPSKVEEYTFRHEMYNKVSGIDIEAAGITLTGSNYIRFQTSGDTNMRLDNNGIVMNTAGKFVLTANDGDGSSITFGPSLQEATFAVGDAGDVRCHDMRVIGDLTVNGNPFPRIVISRDQPTGDDAHNILWFQPGSMTAKNLNFRPNPLTLDNQGAGTLGYYMDYTIPYSAEYYFEGTNLYYGILAKLQFYNMSGYANHKFKASLWTGEAYQQIAYVEQTVGQWATITLDTSGISLKNMLISETGGTIKIRLESTAKGDIAMLLNEDIVLRLKDSSTDNFSVCTVRYKQ